jgi:DMSO/TMAO reductase YedYZ molybdopterin-dependent catalytic subunit
MNRRQFIAVAGIAFPFSVRRLVAEHYVVSADPLMVDFDLGSLRGQYTTSEDFYVRNHGGIPAAAETISLRIEGEVARPLEIIPEHLASLQRHRQGAVLECAGNLVRTLAKVSDGLWEGWALNEVLSMAHPASTGAFVNLFGRDGYERSVPLDQVRDSGLLVTHLNGQPLSRHHGAPWRALFPGWYGMDAVKWLERIEVSKTALPSNQAAYLEISQTASGELERRPLPRVQVKSLILNPENDKVLFHGKLEMNGVAWSGEGQIAKVEVSADGGVTWQAATLKRSGLYDWSWWQSELVLSRPGAVELVCRATDEQGHTQPAERDAKRLDGYVNNWCQPSRKRAIATCFPIPVPAPVTRATFVGEFKRRGTPDMPSVRGKGNALKSASDG